MAHYYFENTPHGKRRDGSKLNTKAHYEYICREGQYLHIAGREEDLVFSSSGNMPPWASSPSEFWSEAELHRRKNGRAYRELRFALQEEFTLEENIELVENLIAEFGIKENHVYSYAIHDKKATFDKEHRNIHCHLMFNEKIIEKERPLPADKFFKQYAVDSNGTPSSGYRTSNNFKLRETTISLRHRWAELCNEKFAEKGIICHISEKSLSVQKNELLAEGKTEEAALLDRIPAPHLGSSYRNPCTLNLIMEEAEKADHIAENYIEIHKENFTKKNKKNPVKILTTESFQENVSISLSEEKKHVCNKNPAIPLEQESPVKHACSEAFQNEVLNKNRTIIGWKILLAANDLAIRRIARQIQQERICLAKLQTERDDTRKAREIQSDPMIVTVGDVIDFMHNKREILQNEASIVLEKYKEKKPLPMDEKKLHADVLDRLFKGQYQLACSEYARLSHKMKELDLKMKELYGNLERVHELASITHDYYNIVRKRRVLGKEIVKIRKAAQIKYHDEYQKIRQRILKENSEMQKACNHLYGKYKNLEKEIKKYDKIILSLGSNEKDTILFSKHLPRMLSRYCKIDGVKPVGGLKILAKNGDSYALLDKMSSPTFSPEKSSGTLEVFSIKLGDEIRRGKVPKYLLKLSIIDCGKWRIQSSVPCLTKEGNPETVNLYPVHIQKKRTSSFIESRLPNTSAVQIIQEREKSIQISRIASMLLGQENNVHSDVLWNDNTNTKDKAMKDEEKLYKGWER